MSVKRSTEELPKVESSCSDLQDSTAVTVVTDSIGSERLLEGMAMGSL